MKKLLLATVLVLSLFNISAQVNPLFWKNLSYYNPAFVDTDTVHYSDTWFSYQYFKPTVNISSLKNAGQLLTGALHNYTLPNGKTNLGLAWQTDKVGACVITSLKFRGAHKIESKIGDFTLGAAFSLNKYKFKSNLIYTQFEQEQNEDYGVNFDLGFQYKVKGLTIASSVSNIINRLGGPGSFITDTRAVSSNLVQYDFVLSDFEISPFVKVDYSIISADPTRKQLGGLVEYKKTFNIGYSTVLKAGNRIFLGTRIGERLHLDYGIVFYTHMNNFHQINVSYVWDKK